MSSIDDKWFKAQQRKAGINADEISAELGKDRSLVSRIYVGRQKMKLEEAEVFARVLGVPLDEVLRRAGIASPEAAQALAPGFSDSDAVAWIPTATEGRNIEAISQVFGAKPGVDVWQVRTPAMTIQGVLPGDFMLVDTNSAERARPGDLVVAQVYDNARGRATTLLRRFEPPVLVAASADPDDRRVYVVDGVNVVIRGRVTALWRV